jgi:hypothetical protein
VEVDADRLGNSRSPSEGERERGEKRNGDGEQRDRWERKNGEKRRDKNWEKKRRAATHMIKLHQELDFAPQSLVKPVGERLFRGIL